MNRFPHAGFGLGGFKQNGGDLQRVGVHAGSDSEPSSEDVTDSRSHSSTGRADAEASERLWALLSGFVRWSGDHLWRLVRFLSHPQRLLFILLAVCFVGALLAAVLWLYGKLLEERSIENERLRY